MDLTVPRRSPTTERSSRSPSAKMLPKLNRNVSPTTVTITVVTSFTEPADDPALREVGVDAAAAAASALIGDPARPWLAPKRRLTAQAVLSASPDPLPYRFQTGVRRRRGGALLALSEAADVWQWVWQRWPPEGYSSGRKRTSEHVYGRSWTVWAGLKSGRSAVRPRPCPRDGSCSSPRSHAASPIHVIKIA